MTIYESGFEFESVLNMKSVKKPEKTHVIWSVSKVCILLSTGQVASMFYVRLYGDMYTGVFQSEQLFIT